MTSLQLARLVEAGHIKKDHYCIIIEVYLGENNIQKNLNFWDGGGGGVGAGDNRIYNR